jgi:DNA-binding PadR family transcriptional regulator
MNSLTLPEWLVLAILSHQPAHGFAVAQQTAPGGELGRIWQIPKAVVYRSIGRLLDVGMITSQGVEPGLGPQRTVYSATEEGAKAAQEWLRTPVAHVRDVRSQLLLKLALLDRAGEDPGDLLRRQRTVLEPIARALEARQAGCTGFDATLLAWRRSTVQAALDFLDAITRATPPLLDSQPPPH